jgi:hypothetical protein
MRADDDAWRRPRRERKQKVKRQRTSRQDQGAIKEFASSRKGVEIYVEPRTLSQEFSVVLVAADGEWVRFHLPDDSWIVKFAHKRGVPIYDAGVLGYPKRMKDYRRGPEA